MIRKKDLAVVSAATFQEGMYISSEIYYQYGNSYVMLCKDVVLTPELIHKLHQSEDSNQSIFVRKTDYDSVIRTSREFHAQLEKENRLKEQAEARRKAALSQSAEPPAPAEKLPRDKSAQAAPAETKKESFVPSDPKFKTSQADPHLSELQKKLRAQREYQDITLHASALIDTVEQTNRVPVQLTDNIARTVDDRLKATEVSTLIQCINSLRKMDDYLYAHSTNVAMLNGLIGRWMKLTEDQIHALIRTGLLHDLGKLRVPAEIMDKPGRLTPEEFEVVKKHPADSCEIMTESGETDEDILKGVRGHHERMNGTGYPDGLLGDEISLFARITAISDVYDAMVAERPYRDRTSPFEILSEFATSRFSNLDMRIIDIFLKNMPGELTGKRVVLSDGRIAKVVYVSQTNFAYPIVKVGGKLISTDATLRCVAMDNSISLLPD